MDIQKLKVTQPVCCSECSEIELPSYTRSSSFSTIKGDILLYLSATSLNHIAEITSCQPAPAPEAQLMPVCPLRPRDAESKGLCFILQIDIILLYHGNENLITKNYSVASLLFTRIIALNICNREILTSEPTALKLLICCKALNQSLVQTCKIKFVVLKISIQNYYNITFKKNM